MSWDDTVCFLKLRTKYFTASFELHKKENYRMGGAYKWPSVQETKAFRVKTRELINQVIDRVEISPPVKWDEPLVVFCFSYFH
jgi:hypothetical protein